MTSLDMMPIGEVERAQVAAALESGYPFVVRGWVADGYGWALDDPMWGEHTGEVTVVPGGNTTVSSASYFLRSVGLTHQMSFRELFDRIGGIGGYRRILAADERYYMFGGSVPTDLIDALPWPDGLAFDGASPYVASSGVSAKAHYDHWFVFLVQLHGKKRVKMFPPSDYEFLYPHYAQSQEKPRRALVDLDNPDFERFPLLRSLHGQSTVLNSGDLLYMPVDWWHEVDTGAFSVSINRRLVRGTSHWLAALLVLAYSVLRGAYFRGVEPIAVREVEDLADRSRSVWQHEYGETDLRGWYDFISEQGRDSARALRIPPEFGEQLSQWLETGHVPARRQFVALVEKFESV